MHERISIDPKVCSGHPVIKGTRVHVWLIVAMIGGGDTIEDLLEAYPHITREDILACIYYAADNLRRKYDRKAKRRGAYAAMLASEQVLRREWDTPEEDEAWAYLSELINQGDK